MIPAIPQYKHDHQHYRRCQRLNNFRQDVIRHGLLGSIRRTSAKVAYEERKRLHDVLLYPRCNLTIHDAGSGGVNCHAPDEEQDSSAEGDAYRATKGAYPMQSADPPT